MVKQGRSANARGAVAKSSLPVLTEYAHSHAKPAHRKSAHHQQGKGRKRQLEAMRSRRWHAITPNLPATPLVHNDGTSSSIQHGTVTVTVPSEPAAVNHEHALLADLRQFTYFFYMEMQKCGMWGVLLEKLSTKRKKGSKITKASIEKRFFPSNVLPLTDCGHDTLVTYIIGLRALMNKIQSHYDSITALDAGRRILIAASENVCDVLQTVSSRSLRHHFLLFLNNDGCLANCSFIRTRGRNPKCLINDSQAQVTMIAWMTRACNAKPPATCKDFVTFIRAKFDKTISERTADRWIWTLGFRYRSNTMKEIYNDGHNRPDVQESLRKYSAIMEEAVKFTTRYHGPEMNRIVPPDAVQPSGRRLIICYHDEVACHSNEAALVRKAWKLPGATGKMKDKDQGELCMAAGYIYICDEFGLFEKSFRIITPGAAANKDNYWSGKDVQEQALEHLKEGLAL